MTHHAPIEVTPIGVVETAFADPSQAPAQAAENYAERGTLVVFDRFADGLDGLTAGRHIWLVSWLHAQDDDAMDSLHCVPRGGQRPTGVFSTRSPVRPNRIGMSLVRIVSIDGNRVEFEGVDLANGTPVLDIKPWVRGIDTAPG
ncbi:tRNA (N6-threonylcarbamoyladenosine(37)-N6)-methyltransferase TrmO [Kibdelosporangium aridum]|uniref:tRNA-Thr(GGU) m(6)t(6)A37 methyltransferase TsaA n=1 Tax=Kibdelosporangium aridum TaxID=2030 RepID=A0A1W1ZKE4_KIBAR|nr:tRNA (N6-threonylcarbamoyladenosine(37)-N6)-methyltransferase TrmO [Kibdelosporangium aridum]SMC48531.1 tRNA-Thr(GGU) m(6)t(6)A37 methyltransferase TsaA [Kibdelosporangium aridum]